ncbi:DNA cytosine methyltransferase [Citrobacter youngae]|uniref:DNA cytosine methyltransferase n=1 Tax=Citrobacter youngae TaxID=133448 RepID=UPI003F1B8306
MTAYYNEIDSFAAQWLRNLMAAGLIAPGIVDERSIEDVTPNDLRGFTQVHFFAGFGTWSYVLRRAGWPDDRPIWTASCPCQPFSAAGKGKGFDDERHLWPALHWLVGQCRPLVIAGEQSASADGSVWLDLVQADMEGLGYAFGACAFPSASVGAPHIRDRSYWVAHSDSKCLEASEQCGARGRVELTDGGGIGGLDHAKRQRQQARRNGDNRGNVWRQSCATGSNGRLADAHSVRSQGGLSGWQDSQRKTINGSAGCGGANNRPGPVNGYWRDSDWVYCRDGKWRPVEPQLRPLVNGATARVGKIRAYGNAINVEAATAFIKAYIATVSYV